MAEIKMPHPAHEEHLCLLQNVGYLTSNPEEYKRLVREGKYVCKDCGRVATNEKNPFAPEKGHLRHAWKTRLSCRPGRREERHAQKS